ncbi:ERO1-like protein [Leptotrombidium deliense]|uniref:ERO1-like protein n=1 Tax=Leptotrombidium deliense TaxID=299467 RepID=A0A443S9V3_9ACAR|nr:ERO1-like protein [Leptotrombidium deliense]
MNVWKCDSKQTAVDKEMKSSEDSHSSTARKLIVLSLIVLLSTLIYSCFFTGPKSETVRQERSNVESFEKARKNVFQKPKTFLESLRDKNVDDFIPLNMDIEPLTISKINNFNNIHLLPRLQSIVEMDYFKFIKLNLFRTCNFWSDGGKCSLRDCTIQVCDESKLPPSIIQGDNVERMSFACNQKVTKSFPDPPKESKEECTSDKQLSQIDETISSERVRTMDHLFECYEDDQEDGQYFDLSLNPERFTGESAHRIWRSIYEENCFLQNQRQGPFSVDNLCYEERVFYRAISGLHSSINIHLCAYYHLMDGSFSYNVREFNKRFEGNEQYVKNLYFVYLLELRALNKIEPYLTSKVNWQSSGDQSVTKEAIKSLLKVIRTFKWTFDERTLFRQEPKVAQEFAEHFRNITNIIDCVSCDKCKLWGKVQIHGLGTAFKILISDHLDKLKLHRHEIVTLINSVARLSNSIHHLYVFEKLSQAT